MGIEGNFKQISSPLLNLVTKDLYLLDLYLHAKKALETDALLTLPKYLESKKIYVHENWDVLLDEEEWRIGRLDIDVYWHAIHYLLTEDISLWEESKFPFIVAIKEEKNRLLINAVMGKTPIDGTKGDFKDYGPVKYLNSDETHTISKALLKISLSDFRERYKEACIFNPNAYAVIWENDEWEYFWEVLKLITEYYRIAADKGRGMLLYLGCFYASDFLWES